jgi:hypothetical protein
MDFSDEPAHSAQLLVHDAQPFNAEPPLAELVRHELTPAALVYGRNHGASPPSPLFQRRRRRLMRAQARSWCSMNTRFG